MNDMVSQWHQPASLQITNSPSHHFWGLHIPFNDFWVCFSPIFWGVDFKQKNCLQNWPFLVTMSVFAFYCIPSQPQFEINVPQLQWNIVSSTTKSHEITHTSSSPHKKMALKDTEVFADVGQRGYGLHVGRGSWNSNDSDETFEVLLDVEGVWMFMVLSNWVITYNPYISRL